MTFEKLAEAAIRVLAERGYTRLVSEEGWCWESLRSRVRLSNPSEAPALMPYTLVRQRYDNDARRSQSTVPPIIRHWNKR
jgi:hypothetical protein